MIAGYQPVIQHLSAEFQVGYVEGQQKERIRIRESVKKKLNPKGGLLWDGSKIAIRDLWKIIYPDQEEE